MHGKAEDKLKGEVTAVKERQQMVKEVRAWAEDGDMEMGEGVGSKGGQWWWVRMEIRVDGGNLKMHEERKWKG